MRFCCSCTLQAGAVAQGIASCSCRRAQILYTYTSVAQAHQAEPAANKNYLRPCTIAGAGPGGITLTQGLSGHADVKLVDGKAFSEIIWAGEEGERGKRESV